MKAIQITQALKDANTRLDAIGNIQIFKSIPKTFHSLTYNLGQRTDVYNKLDVSIHESDGFYDVFTPVDGVDYDQSTQKLGAIFWDDSNNYFTYPIEAKTQQEQDDYAQEQDDADQYGQKTQVRRADGDKMIERFFAYIWRQNGDSILSNQDSVTSVTLLWDALLPLSYGQMEFSKILLNNIDQSGLNQPVKNIIDLAISKVQQYLDKE